MSDRRIVTVTGSQALDFLQGLVTNDLRPLAQADGIRWCALLTPQGKYLADFFVVRSGGTLLLDLPGSLADDTLRRLSMYRLRADVVLAPAEVCVTRGLSDPPPGALPDPRHPALGWRLYGPPRAEAPVDWDALRVEHLIPETGIELVPNDSFILELGFERLNGVDFRKGCYVGQEVTARMKHKTDLRKGLIRVRIDGEAAPGTPILTADGREAGRLHTRSGDRALAWLRFDRAGPGLTAGGARIEPDGG
ncbi:MAG TPA: folate-binding protein [Paracoccaceae bacterium]|nr:folate-binding protein [Paracoccaceae bacterium]HMO72617.1 folate-binding protein [Paracoccaceae bacterium]